MAREKLNVSGLNWSKQEGPDYVYVTEKSGVSPLVRQRSGMLEFSEDLTDASKQGYTLVALTVIEADGERFKKLERAMAIYDDYARGEIKLGEARSRAGSI
jgi:hypothetical protein